jgi:hypothetical protein
MPTGKPSQASAHRNADLLPNRSHPSESRHQSLDRLVPAGWLIGAAATVVVLGLIALSYDAIRSLPPRQDMAAPYMHVIGLNELALAPSVRPARRPAPGPSPIDWRYLPTLPQQGPGIIPLLDEAQLTMPQAALP